MGENHQNWEKTFQSWDFSFNFTNCADIRPSFIPASVLCVHGMGECQEFILSWVNFCQIQFFLPTVSALFLWQKRAIFWQKRAIFGAKARYFEGEFSHAPAFFPSMPMTSNFKKIQLILITTNMAVDT